MSGDNRTRALSIKKEYPDPLTLPTQPSWQQARPQLTLSELIPGQYISTTARIAYVKTSERTDALGTKLIFTGVLEDSTFKASFVSHRISYPLRICRVLLRFEREKVQKAYWSSTSKEGRK